MSAVSVILMILSLGGVWGGLIYYLLRLLHIQTNAQKNDQ